MIKLHPESGAVLQQYPGENEKPLPAIYSTPLLVGDLVYTSSFTGSRDRKGAVFALEVNNLARRWEFDEYFPPRGGDRRSVGRIVADLVAQDGTIFVGSLDHRLYALNSEGKAKWAFDAGSEIWGAPVVHEDRVYVGTARGELVALSRETGRRIPDFRFKAGGAIAGTPWIEDGLIYVGSFDRKLYAVNLKTGFTEWEFSAGNWFWAGPVVHDGIVYAGNMDESVYAMDAKAGPFAGIERFKLTGPVRSSPIVVGDLLVVATASTRGAPGRVWGLDLKELVHSWDVNAEGSIQAPLSSREQVVYAVNQDGVVLALDASKQGRELWRYTPP